MVPLREVIQDIPQLLRAAHQLQQGHVLQHGWSQEGLWVEQPPRLLCSGSLLGLGLVLLCTFPWLFLAAGHLEAAMVESESRAVGACPWPSLVPCSPRVSRPSSFLIHTLLISLFSRFSILLLSITPVALLAAFFPFLFFPPLG